MLNENIGKESLRRHGIFHSLRQNHYGYPAANCSERVCTSTRASNVKVSSWCSSSSSATILLTLVPLKSTLTQFEERGNKLVSSRRMWLHPDRLLMYSDQSINPQCAKDSQFFFGGGPLVMSQMAPTPHWSLPKGRDLPPRALSLPPTKPNSVLKGRN